MKLPATPPPFRETFGTMMKSAVAAGPMALTALAALAATARPVDDKGRYLHWEDFRFKPTDDGLSAAEGWALVRRAREIRRIDTPFKDKAGAVFFFVKTDAIERALHEIDSQTRGGVRFGADSPTRNEAQSFLLTSLIEEPFNSSVFEGAVATRDQAKKIISENRRPRTLGERMVLNNYRAIEFIKSKRHDELTPAIICELQRRVTLDTLENPKKAGVFRDKADDIVVDDLQSGEILHVPPAAAELTRRARELCIFANSVNDGGAFIHPVIRAIILHFILAYDHPFVDGNGRTARALFYWAALRGDYWLLEFISISKQIKEAPIQYGKAFLETEGDEGDLTYFIHNQLDMTLKAISALYEFIERKKLEVKELDATLAHLRSASSFNHRQLALLHRAARAPGLTITINQHLSTTGVSYLTARSDLESLANEGFLVKRKRGATSIYAPAKGLHERLSGANSAG